MKSSGQIALMPFPYTDLSQSKVRPVLLLRRLHQDRDDWLVCMVSSQLSQQASHLDWVLMRDDEEFIKTGLKVSSVFRLSRLAVLDGSLLLGSLGEISSDRLFSLRQRISQWLLFEDVAS